MGNLQELDKLDRAIKDAEIRLKSIYSSLEKIIHEIGVLEPLQKQLEESVVFLKKSETIPILQEFRKIKQELVKTKTRLSLLYIDRVKVSQACKDVEQIIDKFKKDYYKLVVSGENNVVKGKFGKNG